jgi:hypothetical protein
MRPSLPALTLRTVIPGVSLFSAAASSAPRNRLIPCASRSASRTFAARAGCATRSHMAPPTPYPSLNGSLIQGHSRFLCSILGGSLPLIPFRIPFPAPNLLPVIPWLPWDPDCPSATLGDVPPLEWVQLRSAKGSTVLATDEHWNDAGHAVIAETLGPPACRLLRPTVPLHPYWVYWTTCRSDLIIGITKITVSPCAALLPRYVHD